MRQMMRIAAAFSSRLLLEQFQKTSAANAAIGIVSVVFAIRGERW